MKLVKFIFILLSDTRLANVKFRGSAVLLCLKYTEKVPVLSLHSIRKHRDACYVGSVNEVVPSRRFG